jgi:hypothetical protein
LCQRSIFNSVTCKAAARRISLELSAADGDTSWRGADGTASASAPSFPAAFLLRAQYQPHPVWRSGPTHEPTLRTPTPKRAAPGPSSGTRF